MLFLCLIKLNIPILPVRGRFLYIFGIKNDRNPLKNVELIQGFFILCIFAQVNTVFDEFSEKNIYMVQAFPLSAGVWGTFSLCFRTDNGCGVRTVALLCVCRVEGSAPFVASESCRITER